MANPLTQLDLPHPEATVADRLKYLVKLSRRTQAEFSRLAGVDPSNFSKVVTGRLPVTEGLINRVVVNIGVSKDWLTSGNDVPFPRSEHVREITDSGARIDAARRHRGAPVYNIDVTAGCSELSRMFTDERIVGFLDLPQVNPEYPIVRVTGDSMSPKIHDGAFISIRPIHDPRHIAWGQIYVVVLEDYRLVKYVRRHADPSMIVLHSANPDYDDMEVPRADVLSLYLVEAILNYDIIC